LFGVWLLTKSCFASAAHEDIVTTEALQEVSAIGKEMIDGNCAVAAVAASIVIDSIVFPSRISTRDKETTKEVVNAINKYGFTSNVRTHLRIHHDPDGLPARGIKMGGCLAHCLDKLFVILAEHTEFAVKRRDR